MKTIPRKCKELISMPQSTQTNNLIDQDYERSKIILARIEKLRSKLLDITRRNPLISTKFSDRAKSLIRIVDQVPELLFNAISLQKMRIMSLPDLSSDPKDENTRSFQEALAEARLNEKMYLTGLDNINHRSEDASNLLALEERALKDRLREKLNLPARQKKHALSLHQHARNHGISPNYELPTVTEKSQHNCHKNIYIQTLMLPDVMLSRLSALLRKEQTWKEETGVSVLYMALGFLEWEDGNNSDNIFSPLLLIPVQLEKKITSSGPEFWVNSDDDGPEENKVLAEKLRLEFNIKLPKYNGQGLSAYLKEVAAQKPKGIQWRVRRWGAIGVFPSSALSMYHDLEPSGWNFDTHSLLANLFGGSKTGHDAVPFADEYNIDKPEIEKKVPYLIADADSSQFSAIVDIAGGKSLAVEGPPGTGKSQTIVNTIAASLAAGKKVLFVAEKSAALDVVKTRLEAFGIGDFILPLQAKSCTRAMVMTSIKNRIEMPSCSDPSELDQEIKRFKNARDMLQVYVETLSTFFEETGLTVHNILGRSIKASDIVDSLPKTIKNLKLPQGANMSSERIKEIFLQCKPVEDWWRKISTIPGYWQRIQIPNIDPFTAEEVLQTASEASAIYDQVVMLREKLIAFNIRDDIKSEDLRSVEEIIKQTTDTFSEDEIKLVESLNNKKTISNVTLYLKQENDWHNDRRNIAKYVVSPLDSRTLESLAVIENISQKYSLVSLNDNALREVLDKKKNIITDTNEAILLFEQVAEISDVLSSLSACNLIKVIDRLSTLSSQALKLRSEDLDDPAIQSIITKHISRARALKKQQDSLEGKFHLISLPESDIIEKFSDILLHSSIFSFFSKERRIAKSFYKSINKDHTFKQGCAVRELRTISKWVAGVQELSEEDVVKKIFSIHYDGLETDWTPLEAVINLFQWVEETFPSINYSSLRSFIKYGDTSKIKSLPKISKNHSIHSFRSLTVKELITEAEDIHTGLSECEDDNIQLCNNLAIFKDQKNITIALVQEVAIKLTQLLKTQKKIQSDTSAQEILGAPFNSHDTRDKDFQNSLKLALDLTRLEPKQRDSFISCLKRNSLNDLRQLIEKILHQETQAFSVIQKIARLTNTDPLAWAHKKNPKEMFEFMRLASEDKEGLDAYSRLYFHTKKLDDEGYREFLDLMFANKRYNLCDTIEALMIRQIARDLYNIYGDTLRQYDGDTLDGYRKSLQDSDRKIIQLSRQRLKSQLYRNANPPNGNGYGKKSTYTQLALLKHEIAKKKRHISLRSLTERASTALLELKPCWMMSPLSVAQYIPKGLVEFDLLIIDEASQMTPENAVGALARAKQAMVVGDTNQLPPTGFFRKVFEDEEATEDEKVTEESILEMANACFKPARRLRWHYRSRHSGLISFSNRYVYNDDLIVFPSAQEDHPSMGVFYVKVAGLYSAGTNPVEARVMVDRIINFMQNNPNKSLGIVVLNKKQRDLLAQELDYALAENSQAREYKEKWDKENDGLESFFVKNLENVQGDERDVIFIGTVYGPEKENIPVMQRFGPISGVAGKRRLNVLFSRAKESIFTFSSMTSADIRAEESSNPGAHMLKCWLEYSASRVLQSVDWSGNIADSEFEEHVIKQIQSMGCEAHPQVGVKGFFIDIGVKHPDWPHGFLIGVECDGASYHSSFSARDRDRLRQEILEGLGWTLYRIWSTDWFEDPIRETKKLREFIEKILTLKTQCAISFAQK